VSSVASSTSTGIKGVGARLVTCTKVWFDIPILVSRGSTLAPFLVVLFEGLLFGLTSGQYAVHLDPS
jgi:hypothetical protein